MDSDEPRNKRLEEEQGRRSAGKLKLKVGLPRGNLAGSFRVWRTQTNKNCLYYWRKMYRPKLHFFNLSTLRCRKFLKIQVKLLIYTLKKRKTF